MNPFYINSYEETSFGLRTTFRNELSLWTEVWLYTTMCKLWDLPVELELLSCSFRQPASCGTRMAVACAVHATLWAESMHYIMPLRCVIGIRWRHQSFCRSVEYAVGRFPIMHSQEVAVCQICCSEVEKCIKKPGWRQHSFDQGSRDVTIVLVHSNLFRRLVEMRCKLPEIVVRAEVGVLDQDVPSPTGTSVWLPSHSLRSSL